MGKEKWQSLIFQQGLPLKPFWHNFLFYSIYFHCVPGRLLREPFQGFSAEASGKFSHVAHKSRLIALPALRYRREIGTVRLHEDAVRRQLPDDFRQPGSILIGQRTIHAQEEAQLQELLRHLPAA